MSLIINTNIASLNAQRQLSRSGAELDKATARLSSGKRLNSASDDAAGLAISNRMTSQVRGLEQAVRNTNDGISLLQVADGALNETSNMLQRIRELSVQASNGVYSDGDRKTLNAEVKQLLSQIDFVSKNTQFNGVNLLDGSKNKIELQVGADAGQTVAFKIASTSTEKLGLGSKSADIIGAPMQIDDDGTLSHAVQAGTLKINGTNLPSLTGTTKVSDLLSAINTKIPNVEASTNLVLQAEAAGSGVLQGASNLQLTAVALDGSSVTYTISNTTSLDDLIKKIDVVTGGRIQASVDESNHLVLSSDQLSTLKAVDSTAGTATGISPGASPSTDVTNILTGLNNYWISEAENKISTYFGLVGDGRDMALNIIAVDGAGNTLAYVDPNPGSFSLNLDSVDFSGVSLPNGPNAGMGIYGDRIIAHEMVHAVMATRMNLGILDGWFTEGIAEFIHGADERVWADIGSGALDTVGEFQTAWDGAQAPGSPGALGYSAGYVAVKMLHQSILTAGGAGISEVLDRLELGNTFDQALQFVSTAHSISSWTDQTSFEALARARGFNFMTGAVDATLDAAVGAGKRLDLTGGAAQTDTGSVAGSDYGNPALNAANVMPNVATQGPIHFHLVVPAQYLGGNLSADARLVLKSTNGEAINVTRGASGSDADLQSLGLQETAKDSVVGYSVSSAHQSLALAANDLIINGKDVGVVAGNLGLQGKLDAINSLSDTTGVIASMLAKDSYTFKAGTRTEWVSSNTGPAATTEVIGLRGVGVQVTSGESLETVARHINQFSTFHGATSYVDTSGRLHIFSEQPLNPQQSTSFFTDIGLASNVGTTGSLNIRGVEVSLSNINNLDTVLADINSKEAQTGVHVRVDENGEIEFSAQTSFNIKLGITNGLKTMATLGMSVGVTASGNDLNDTNADHSLSDEKIQVDPRIHLKSLTGETIRVAVNTTNAADATGLVDFNNTDAVLGGSNLSGLNISTADSAKKAIETVDNALNSISATRSEIGAINNRLDFTVANLTNVIEKTTSALSRIVDSDFAEETSKLSRAQVLQQAAQSMLAQANSRPQQVLSLLR